ncbi:hypothetical protein [Streptomyces sp. NPDC005732]|uniref:hypothetical protein n=1 Tax=Streptomyces sp. NPDC005732 TaxID=3157057 RepID=UPI0033D21FB0
MAGGRQTPPKGTPPAPTGPRGLGGYCWAEDELTHLHCTKPPGHTGQHFHTYTRKSWG